jgi:hypothetical protein
MLQGNSWRVACYTTVLLDLIFVFSSEAGL